MKILLLIIVITPILGQESAEDSLNVQDNWFTFDKVQHTTFSFLWVLSTQYIAVNKFDLDEKQAFPISFTSAASIGLLKEIYDWKKPNGHFSKRDLIADLLGLCLASVFVFAQFD